MLLLRNAKVLLVALFVAGFGFGAAQAALTPVAPYQAQALPEPNPPTFAYAAGIGYYGGKLLYAGDDGKIHAYDVEGGSSTLVCDTSSLTPPYYSIGGFFIASDGHLYFHDNGTTAKIYRIRLADPWPALFQEFDTRVGGSIYAFAENPWTGTVWFASADFFGAGNNFYLHEIQAGFAAVRLRAAFVKPHPAGGGNGPLLFNGPATVLYGESVWGGDGYFHLVNANTGEVIEENHLTVPGGLADATHGYNREIFAVSGGGKRVLRISGSTATEIAASGDEAQGLQFGGGKFYVSEMVPFGGSEPGRVRFNTLFDPSPVAAIEALSSDHLGGLLPNPSPAAFAYASSIAFYNGFILYAGADGKIHGYDTASGASVLVCDTSPLATAFSAVQGFLVSADGHLYFHDNAVSAKIYRVKLSDPWPAAYSELDTGVPGAIYAFAENPWDRTVWFASADFFGAGNQFYLHQVNAGFSAVTERASFTQPHSGGNGPLVFLDPTTVLYGESVWGGDGYFHEVDTRTGALTPDRFTFPGGVAGAVRGFDGKIHVATGGGKKIFVLDGSSRVEIAATRRDAQGLAFDGASLFISGMAPFSGGGDDGAIEFLSLWKKRASGVPADQRVGATVDLNGDGIPDVQQPETILAVNAAGAAGRQLGAAAVSPEAGVDALEAVDPATVADTTGRPASLPFGLIRLRLSVPGGEEAQVRIYLSEAAPVGAKWYKYDPISGWQDYSANAVFSADRKSVTLTLKDGGAGDADRVVNGEILDPGGVGVADSTEGGGGGGGGCFLAAAETEIPAAHAMFAAMLALLLAAAVLQPPGKRGGRKAC
ncbi:MAG: choice-of-anchor U domain-containing protein [Desulfobacterales bacterium]